MEKQIFGLKFAAKQMQRCAIRCNKDEVESKNKLKAAIKKGDHEGARIHAENAIRHKHTATSYLRLAARIDAVVSRVQTAMTTKNFTKSIMTVVNCMENAAKTMDMEKVSCLMDKFEREFDNMDIQSKIIMPVNRIIYSGAFVKNLRPFSVQVTKMYNRRHFDDWQYA
ncbi:unnamed protein product [Schistosoma curassoni]|nr:unnamed protein product [Schistosoma curassoni]